jgi:hypothetical protein
MRLGHTTAIDSSLPVLPGWLKRLRLITRGRIISICAPLIRSVNEALRAEIRRL